MFLTEQKNWRVEHGEGWAEAGKYGDQDCFDVVRCRAGGLIYTHSDSMLGYLSPPNKARRGLFELLVAMGCEPHAVGDLEFSVIFPHALLDSVAKRVGARKKRRLNPELKASAAKRLAKFRFKTRTSGAISGPKKQRRGVE